MAHSNAPALGYDRVPIWESAFKIAEAPMSYLNHLQIDYAHGRKGCFIEFFETLPTSFCDHAEGVFNGLRNRQLRVIGANFAGFGWDVKTVFTHLYEKKHLLAISLATGVAFPLTLAAVPFSIIADIFAGVIQASLRLCQGAGRGEISSILHKKIIASPVQQSVYFLMGTVVISVFGCKLIFEMYFKERVSLLTAFARVAFFVSALMGEFIYYRNQEIIASLPKTFRPDGYNVFTGGGAEDYYGKKVDFDPESSYQKWKRERPRQREQRHSRASGEDYSRSHQSSHGESSNGANSEDILRQTAKDIRAGCQAKIDKLAIRFSENQFKEFKDWFKNGRPTYALFGFSNANEVVSEETLRKKYRPLAFKCHPDKFPNNRAEAEIWIQLLNEARLDVETNVLKLDKSVKQE